MGNVTLLTALRPEIRSGSSSRFRPQRLSRSKCGWHKWEVSVWSRQPETFGQSRSIAKEGCSVARNAREDIESRLGHSVLSESNASDKKALEIKTDSTGIDG